MEENRRARPVFHDGEGRAVIDLSIRDDSRFLSPYNMGEQNVIDSEMADFIEHSLNPVPHKEHIHFRIHSDAITEREQAVYTAAIHSYYADCYRNTCFEKKRLHRIAFFMALISVFALSAMIAFEAAGKNPVFIEAVDIFAWVFMWEAVDVFFLQCGLLRFRQKRYLALADSVVEYVPEARGDESR